MDAPGTPVLTRELWPLCAALGLLCFILMILVRRLPAAPAMPKVARAATVGLAMLATLGTWGLPSSATAQPADKPLTLTPAQQEQIDGFIKLEPAEGREKLKEYCRELTQFYGDLQPLRSYLQSKGESPKVMQFLAVAAFADGDLAAASAALTPLVSPAEPDLWALSELARTQEMQGNDTEALPSLQRALETDRGSDDAVCPAGAHGAVAIRQQPAGGRPQPPSAPSSRSRPTKRPKDATTAPASPGCMAISRWWRNFSPPSAKAGS